MAVLMNVGKPLQTADNIFMTEWVAIFRESGLRDDVTIANLQDACLKLVVLARARARELQVDQQVERAQQPLSAKTAIPTTKPKPKSSPASDKPVCRSFLKPDGCKNGDNCQYAHPRTNGKCLRCGSESHNLQACARPRRQQSSRSDSLKPAPKKTQAKPKGKAAENQGSQEKKKSKGKSKGKGSQTKPTAKSGDVDFDDNAQAEQEDQDEDQSYHDVTIPLCPLGRVIRTVQLTAIWTPQTLILNCVNKSGTAQGLMQCPIKGDTPYFTAVQFWMLRRALQLQRKGQKHFPPSFWKQLYLAAIAEGPDLKMAAKGVEKGQAPSPDMTKCSLPQLSSYATRTLLGQGLLQAAA